MENSFDLAERIGDLLFDAKTSDVTFIVEGEALPAHKAILATSSQYFRALLFGNMRESSENIVALEGVPLRGFKSLMSYVYTGRLKLEEMDLEFILEILEVAHLFCFEKLQIVLCKHLQEKLDLENLNTVFSTAHRLQLKDLSESCNRLIFEDPPAFLKSAGFCDISESLLRQIISNDAFCAKEIEIFEAVTRWCAKRPDGENRSSVLEGIRLPLIDCKDLVSTVADSGLIARDAIFDAIRTKECEAASMRYRASMSSGVNLANPDLGACELESNQPEDLFTDAGCSVYRKKTLPRYPSVIKIVSKTGLTVALRQPFFVNHIAFKLTMNSYYIEISMDLKKWVRVIDHSGYSCHSLQELYFEPRATRYIRVIATKKAEQLISTFEVSYVVKPFKLICGFYAPEENVATTALWRAVRMKNDGSGGNEYKPIESSEWMTHETGEEWIICLFSQPYTVDSLRLFLRNDDSRAYKYFIETLAADNKWRRVADETANFCHSWQRITFVAHPVLCMRIVGTVSSLDKFFSFSHFECPAQKKPEDRLSVERFI